MDAFLHVSSALTHQTPNGGNLLNEHSAVAWLLNSPALRETLDSQVLEKLYKFVEILLSGEHRFNSSVQFQTVAAFPRNVSISWLSLINILFKRISH